MSDPLRERLDTLDQWLARCNDHGWPEETRALAAAVRAVLDCCDVLETTGVQAFTSIGSGDGARVAGAVVRDIRAALAEHLGGAA